jgi:hypothetical protein
MTDELTGDKILFTVYDHGWDGWTTPRGPYEWHIGGKSGEHMLAVRKAVPDMTIPTPKGTPSP